jgi:thioredoxin 1
MEINMKRVLRFTASWCGPCKMLAENLSRIETNIPIEVYDIEEHFSIAVDFGIRSVPTLVMLDENVEVKRKVGLMQKDELQEWLNENA